MAHPQILWYRIFGVYFALAAVFLIAGAMAGPPLRDVLLTIGVCLVAAFAPIVMGIYFLRGLRGSL